MSTEIGTLKKTGSRNVDLHINRYFGGSRKGVCVQLTAKMEEGHTGYVQLSKEDILNLLPILYKFIFSVQEDKNIFEISDEVEPHV